MTPIQFAAHALAGILVLAACGGKSAADAGIDAAAPRVLPDTGQTGDYAAAFGEDSDFSINPPSYTANGDGTVTDAVTGLMWAAEDGGEMAYDEAAAYCASCRLGGHADWRLPTAHELYSINDLGAIGPALDTAYFSYDPPDSAAAEYVRELYWWSSSPRADTDGRRWVTNAGGGIGAHLKGETASAGVGSPDGKNRYFHVRPVRDATVVAPPSNRFTAIGDGTVADNYTGLVWQARASEGSYAWEEALAYVNALDAGGGFAGRTDWRLPNIRELFSLVDPAMMAPCVDPAYFDLSALAPYAEPATPDEPGALWSSTSMYDPMPENSTRAWDLHDLYSGIVSYSEKTATERLLLVRGGE